MLDYLWPRGLYSPWNSPGQNSGVHSLSFLQGILPTQGSNPGLPHCRWILYQLSHQGSPRILEWVAYPFSSGSSRPRNRTGVSCITGRFFTSWAMREAQRYRCWVLKNKFGHKQVKDSKLMMFHLFSFASNIIQIMHWIDVPMLFTFFIICLPTLICTHRSDVHSMYYFGPILKHQANYSASKT